VVERMLELGHVSANDTVYDLGSGDGRIVIAAAQKFGAKAVGVEVVPDLCRQAQQRIKELGLSDRASIVEGNVFRVDISAATVVTMYFMTDSNERLRPNLEKYLKPGTRVISNQFPIKGWKPISVEKVKAGMDYTIYVYQIGHTK
jgi:predicted RNA methylase